MCGLWDLGDLGDIVHPPLGVGPQSKNRSKQTLVFFLSAKVGTKSQLLVGIRPKLFICEVVMLRLRVDVGLLYVLYIYILCNYPNYLSLVYFYLLMRIRVYNTYTHNA